MSIPQQSVPRVGVASTRGLLPWWRVWVLLCSCEQTSSRKRHEPTVWAAGVPSGSQWYEPKSFQRLNRECRPVTLKPIPSHSCLGKSHCVETGKYPHCVGYQWLEQQLSQSWNEAYESLPSGMFCFPGIPVWLSLVFFWLGSCRLPDWSNSLLWPALSWLGFKQWFW